MDIEQIDNLTNEIMDYVRVRFAVPDDSDLDDEIYTQIHNIVRG